MKLHRAAWTSAAAIAALLVTLAIGSPPTVVPTATDTTRPVAEPLPPDRAEHAGFGRGEQTDGRKSPAEPEPPADLEPPANLEPGADLEPAAGLEPPAGLELSTDPELSTGLGEGHENVGAGRQDQEQGTPRRGPLQSVSGVPGQPGQPGQVGEPGQAGQPDRKSK